jgi:hypothetical protein
VPSLRRKRRLSTSPGRVHATVDAYTSARYPRPPTILYTHPPTRPRTQAVFVTSGAAGAQTLRSLVRSARAEQRDLCAADALTTQRRRRPAPAVAVDALFFRRLVAIVK